MRAWRRLFRDHRQLAALVVALALCMKALMPAGFMPVSAPLLIAAEICADASGADTIRHIAIPMKDGERGKHSDDGKAKATCAWSALAMASLAGPDPALLALALAFILAVGMLSLRSPLVRRALHIRPPLRGPPLPT